MSAAFPALEQRALQRADDRRFSIALGVSLVIHALLIAFLRGLVPTFNPNPQAGAGIRAKRRFAGHRLKPARSPAAILRGSDRTRPR
jgi:hypothetical protein